MRQRKNILAPLVSAAIVAVGLMIVWLVVAGWGSRLTGNLFGGKERIYEGLIVTYEGVPLIVTSIGNSSNRRSYRKLDGSAVEFQDNGSLYSRPLGIEPGIPGLFEYSVSWTKRLGNTSDLANPAVYWHLVRNGKTLGHVYFVGYDSVSKHIVGYLGRQGFRAALPPHEEWFDVGRFSFNRNLPVYASTISMDSADSYNQWRYQTASNRNSPPDWVGFLTDGKQLYQIDFRQRTVSVFDESAGATALRFAAEPKMPRINTEVSNDTTSLPAEDAVEEEDEEEDRPKTVSRFLVRYPDRVVVWNMKKQTNQTFSLPESLHHGSFDGYTLGNGQMIIQHGEGYWDRGPQYRLIWIDTAGNELRTELVKLIGHKPSSERQLASKDAWAVPLPAYWVYRMFVRRPFQLLEDQGMPTYWAALQQTWQAGWSKFVALLAISVGAAVVVWRWHKRYARPQAVWWSLFVLLFSIPGLIAYRLFHGIPVVETCPECNQKVSRNRDACAECQQPFAEPKLLGTEVFV